MKSEQTQRSKVNITKIIENQFKLMRERNWDQIFWLIDFHGTIKPSSYISDDGGLPFYPNSIECLKKLTERDDCCLIMWTSSYPEYLEKHFKTMEDLGVKFDYFNENPVCESTNICDFSSKLYFNVLLDDKAGFDPEKDWEKIIKKLE